MKYTNFANCDFSNAEIRNSPMEASDFKGSKITNLIFENNTSYGGKAKLNTKTLKIEQNIHKFNSGLYDYIPEFEKIVDHSTDEYLYSVFWRFKFYTSKRNY